MTTEDETKSRMVRDVELLWGLDSPPARRGPKPKLSREAVVHKAIEIADAEGIEAVSMQRVAKELGYTTMSLYRHVDSKEDMLVLMLDTAMDGVPPGPREDGDWRAGLEEWCHGAGRMYRAHPWSVLVSLSGPPSGPNGLRWMEAGLRELVASGLDVGEALQMLMLLSAVLRETIRIEADMLRAAQATGGTVFEIERDYGHGLRRVVTAEAFPTIARMLEESVLEEEPGPGTPDRPGGPAEELDFGIRRVLDGIEAHVRAKDAAGGPGEAG
ncbi:TetR/AcrR family transcriptional regulator [Nocardiopsis sp. N85]|uniref:TetR/AcrR family transcriptional regulator n=1 Tax=Nocardiopsis sp. N85 TaxID=3029400 RepID=UPI00237F8C30|nr:TetR/AcrR family transcriptional regulator [Nocardiopsis sp. N85]MDE3723629.1 TetR/AcrR family transcriptional regulator [Nocardiopsis sp. N85]